jgi:hypothetical protein
MALCVQARLAQATREAQQRTPTGNTSERKDGKDAMTTTPPGPSNMYVRAILHSLARWYSQPRRIFVQAKRMERELVIDRRTVGRAWRILAAKTGLLQQYSSGRNGHGGYVWELDPSLVRPLMLAYEALPYHVDAVVYEALGYPTMSARHRQRGYRRKHPEAESP